MGRVLTRNGSPRSWVGMTCSLWLLQEAWDEDMAQRIARHQQERPAAWRTLETPRQVGRAIALHLHDTAVVLVDCLTLLVSNTLLHCGASPDPAAAEAAVQEEVTALVQTCQTSAATLYCREQ